EHQRFDLQKAYVRDPRDSSFELVINGTDWVVHINFTKHRQDTAFVLRNLTINHGDETYSADSSPKFMTSLSKMFVCSSQIEIPLDNGVLLSLANITLQAFNLQHTTETEICPRDMKATFPVTQLTGATLGIVIGGAIVALAGVAVRKHFRSKNERTPNIMWCVNPARMVVDASGKAQEKEGREAINQCLKSLQASGYITNSTYDQIWLSTPSYRYLGLCPHDAAMVGMLLEMQAHLSFLYAGKDGRLGCQIVSLAPPTNTSSGFSVVTPRNASRPIHAEEVEAKRELNYTSLAIISDDGMTFCGNRTRKMGIYLDPAGDGVPWVLEFTWSRKPEYYEDGEVGWSSVGAHLGALSGTFGLTEIQLTYSLSSLSILQAAIGSNEVVATSKNLDRFRARAGDFYQCASSRHIVLTSFLNASKEKFINRTRNQGISFNDTNVVYVVLTTRHIKLQSFGDFNRNSFTGAVLTRLYDRDKELQSYELEYCKMTNKGLLPSASTPIRRDEMKVLSRNCTLPV
ncbi:unnamed protein product, partial [Hydatigera taeniaeformis]|uniref:Ig-like domain-containing protein n=1 Tax=Hydatigena taeniaeformis TaxID=6205 RepID=A0A0R3WMM3_HYDTA